MREVPRALAPWSAVITNTVSLNHGRPRAPSRKRPERIVGVLHRAVAPLAGRDVDAPGRIGVGAVVAGGHDVREHRAVGTRGASRGRSPSARASNRCSSATPQTFSNSMPATGCCAGRPSGSRWPRKRRSCCRSSRSRRRRTARRSPCPRTRCPVKTARRCSGRAHDRLPRRRRQRERQRFQTAHRAVAGGVDVAEPQALVRQAIEVGRQALRVP